MADYSAEALSRAAHLLRGGGVIAFPTDTVYGIAAHAFLPAAVQRLYTIKERPLDRAIPLLLSSAGDVRTLCRDVPPLAWALMERFWPGPLTIVLWAQPHVPQIVTAGKGSVAVRLPDHFVPRALAEAIGAPLAATSANISGQPSAKTAQDVIDELDGKIDFILDGGPRPNGTESTVVDLTQKQAAILRHGALADETLAALLATAQTP